MDAYRQVSPLSNVLPPGVADGFVDRRAELEAIRSAFSAGARGVVIIGPAGVGKTTLAAMFAHRCESDFAGGLVSGTASWAESPGHLIQRLLGAPRKRPALLLLNDADAFDEFELRALHDLVAADKELRVLLTSRRELSLGQGYEKFVLGGLDRREFEQLLELRNAVVHGQFDPTLAERLFTIGGGNALFADLALQAVTSGIVASWDELFAHLRSFTAPGVLGPDGLPATSESPSSQQIIVDVSSANDAVLRLLKEQPELAWSLPPRRFEEIVAEILEKQGYEVELTPASGDGGFDIYAARREGLGKFLYLVECKRYRPPTKVGVEIVRSLYGVIQTTRATAGAIVTTSFFTAGAKEYQRQVQYQMHLHDYLVLQNWIAEFPVVRN